MIHDAKVEVSCDGKDCWSSVQIALEYRYSSYAAGSGGYEDGEDAIEADLMNDEDWLVVDGKHYCEEDCLPG